MLTLYLFRFSKKVHEHYEHLQSPENWIPKLFDGKFVLVAEYCNQAIFIFSTIRYEKLAVHAYTYFKEFYLTESVSVKYCKKPILKYLIEQLLFSFFCHKI